MYPAKEIETITLQTWLHEGKKVTVIDVRPLSERAEWHIPGSVHLDVYDKLKSNDPKVFNGLEIDKTIPVVTYCAGGKMSLTAAGLLQGMGYEAYSLKGGMKGWNLSWNIASLIFDDFQVIQFRRTGKGCLSYLISSKSEAMIVDASLPTEVYREFLQQNNLHLKFVADTHIHADHLSRSMELAELFNVRYFLPVRNKATVSFMPVENNTLFNIGSISVQAIHSPGHTIESTCYLVNNKILLTGDTVFVNGVGRPDLKADNDEALLKSKMLYQSLQQLLKLDGDIIVLPGHSSKPVEFDKIPIQTTIAELKKNLKILWETEKDFVSSILSRIPPTPDNYMAIAERNLSGKFNEINTSDLEAGANRCAIT